MATDRLERAREFVKDVAERRRGDHSTEAIEEILAYETSRFAESEVLAERKRIAAELAKEIQSYREDKASKDDCLWKLLGFCDRLEAENDGQN